MSLIRWQMILGLAVSLAMTPALRAQQPAPRIGYVYPAGGQQGTTFQVVIGGQRLKDLKEVFVSSSGVQALMLERARPLTPQEFREYLELKAKVEALEAKRLAASQAGKPAKPRGGKEKPQPAANAPTGTAWTPEDGKLLSETKQKLAALVRKPAGAIRKAPTPALADILVAQVTLAADAEPGPREIRVAGPSGMSNPLAFHVGQVTEFSEVASETVTVAKSVIEKSSERPQTSNPKTEMTVTLPATINGQVLPGEVNRYRFAAKKGQRLVIAVSARQLIPYISDAVPGWFQATLSLRNAAGKELAYADSFRFNPDPVLHFEIPDDGEYVIAIKDSLYRGREDFVYRITVGALPFVTGIFPLGGPAGAQTAVEVMGWNLPDSKLVVDGKEKSPGIHQLAVRKDGHISNFMPFAVDTLPERLEEEPNNTPETARRITLPVILNGRIESAEDTDVFCFEGRAGDQVVAEVMARRLNSPLDSALKLTDASGNQIAFNDDHADKGAGLTTHQADSYLQATLPANGVYFLHLNDAQHKGGPEHAYRLRVSAPRPDFDLRIVPASVSARAGRPVPITVYALRKDGFAGDIALSLKDMPAGFALGAATVPATQAVARLTLTVQPAIESLPTVLKLEGRATIQGRGVSHPALPAEDMMQAFEYRHLVPASELKLAMTGSYKIAGPPKILGNLPVKIPVGGTARVRFAAPAFAFSGKPRFELRGAPEGVTLKNLSPSRDGGEIVLQCDPKAKSGQKGSLTFGAPAGITALPPIPFEIVPR
ncbi:MAG: peptidase [Verrucomicrobia bacterium]|nr:peptidase [Verrucomicrobiota bacterium]